MGDNMFEEMRCLKQALNTLPSWGYWKVSLSSWTHLESSERLGWILSTRKPRWDARFARRLAPTGTDESGRKVPAQPGEVE